MTQEHLNALLKRIDNDIDELLNHFNKVGNRATPEQQRNINLLAVKLEALKRWSIQ